MDNMRALDNLGRIVIPSEIRKALNLREKELLHIFYNGTEVVIKKPSNSCVFCGGKDDLEELNKRFICRSCISKLNNDHTY